MSARILGAKLAVLTLAGSLLVPGAVLADGASISFHYGYPSFPTVGHYYAPAYSGYYCPPAGYYSYYSPYWNGGDHHHFYGYAPRKHHYGHRRYTLHDHHRYSHHRPPSYSYYEPRRHNRVGYGLRHND